MVSITQSSIDCLVKFLNDVFAVILTEHPLKNPIEIYSRNLFENTFGKAASICLKNHSGIPSETPAVVPLKLILRVRILQKLLQKLL